MYALSPDGQEVAYASNIDEIGATSTNNEISLVLRLAVFVGITETQEYGQAFIGSVNPFFDSPIRSAPMWPRHDTHADISRSLR